MQQSTRHAYTFIELLVVMAIIGILVGLLLPAVNQARNAARRAQCQNNLNQLILAVQQYEMAFQVYPPGTIEARGPILNQPIGYHHNWVSQILPLLEQPNAYDHLDRRVGVYHPNNQPVRKLHLRGLRCPQSPAGGRGYSDYAGVHHSTEAPIDVDNNGVFFLNSRVRRDDVIDGLSNTMFIGEKATIPGDLGWLSGTRATLRNGGTALNAALPIALWTKGSPPGVEADALAIDEPLAGDELLSALFGYAEETELPSAPLRAVGGFLSLHRGGGLFAFGDGSVRFVSDSAAPVVLSRLADRADQQILDEDAF